MFHLKLYAHHFVDVEYFINENNTVGVYTNCCNKNAKLVIGGNVSWFS